MKKKFTYRTYHIPTNTWFDKKEIELFSELEFLRLLNSWNCLGNGQWLYVSFA